LAEYTSIPATKFHPLAPHGRHQQIALFGQQHVFPENFVADGTGTVYGKRNVAGMLHLGDFVRVAHDVIDLIAEPHVHRFIHKSAGYKSQQDRRDERKSDKGGHKFRAKAGAEQPVAPFEVGLDDVSREEQQQHDEADQIQVDQQEDKRIAGGRKKGIRIFAARYHDLSVIEGQRQTRNEEQQQNPDRPQMTLMPFRFRKKNGAPRRRSAARLIRRRPALRTGPDGSHHAFPLFSHPGSPLRGAIA
jgi:hypothetical protein